jgi:hypothetical protein
MRRAVIVLTIIIISLVIFMIAHRLYYYGLAASLELHGVSTSSKSIESQSELVNRVSEIKNSNGHETFVTIDEKHISPSMIADLSKLKS